MHGLASAAFRNQGFSGLAFNPDPFAKASPLARLSDHPKRPTSKNLVQGLGCLGLPCAPNGFAVQLEKMVGALAQSSGYCRKWYPFVIGALCL